MACLKETVVQKLLEPMMNAVTSAQRTFSRGGAVRSALTLKLLDCICAVAVRLGTDAAAHVVSDLALKLLKSFQDAPSGGSSSSTKMSVSRSNSEQRPDYMRHQRKLSSTLRLVQAAADDGKESGNRKQTAASGIHPFTFLHPSIEFDLIDDGYVCRGAVADGDGGDFHGPVCVPGGMGVKSHSGGHHRPIAAGTR